MGINLSLRAKLLFLVLAVLVCFGGTISFYMGTRVAGDLKKELLKRGESIARHLAEISAEAFIENDHLRMQFLAKEHKATEADIRYILMIDRNGELLAHSFGTTFPPELVKANRHVSGREASLRQLDTGSEIVYDIAVPVLDGRVGSLRVGISAEPINTTVAHLIGEILAAVLIVGILAFALTLPVTQAIAGPLSSLARALESLGKGHRDLRLPADRRDEIGMLNDAFNQMAADVRTAEKQLAAQVQFLQVLMEDLPVPVFYKDREGRMLGCNSAFAEFWGKSVDQIVGHRAAELYPPADASLHQGKDVETLRQERSVAYEHVVTGADGNSHDMIFHKTLFRDENGQPAGILGVMHDVTLQREANRLKSEFISTVAHEFQTPLATILGFSELLHDDALNEEERKTALRMIINKAETLSQMVDELLDLARLEGGRALSIDKAPCELNRLLTASIEGFRLRITTHQFALDLPTPPLVIEADCDRIGQVVENLLSNAVKYSKVASIIHVSAGSSEGVCRIVVRDEGRGMSPDQLKHLFDKFYRVNTTKTAPHGTGLGLFIVKSIVEAHQGEIHIDSVLGQGTTVTVSLPLGAKN